MLDVTSQVTLLAEGFVTFDAAVGYVTIVNCSVMDCKVTKSNESTPTLRAKELLIEALLRMCIARFGGRSTHKRRFRLLIGFLVW